MKFPISNFQFPIFNFFKFLALLLLHTAAVGVILYAFRPIATWYLDYRPLWGVDFFLTASLVKFLDGNVVAPFSFWAYSWFGGFPIFIYPSLSTYIIAALGNFFDLVYATQLWMMIATGLFLIGSYFLFFTVSRNIVLSAILAIATSFSAGVYQTLTWAGSLPSYAAQAAFPWTLGFLVRYLGTKNIRSLLTSGLIAGISIWAHPLVFIVYILPATFILTFTNFESKVSFFKKIKSIFIFLGIAAVIALPVFYSTFSTSVKSAFKSGSASGLSTTTSSVRDVGAEMFNKLQPARMYTDNHQAPFALLGVMVVLFLTTGVIARAKNPVLAVIPFVLTASYFAFYVWVFGQGISIYHGGWYRLFWHVPIWVGALVCVLWRASFDSARHFIKSRSVTLFFGLGGLLSIIAVGGFYLYFFGHDIAIYKTIYRSQVSSSHPDIINVKVTDEERESLKSRLLPSFINQDERNWRLYSGDQTFNLWFNSLFRIPLARGYLDPPLTSDKRGWLFLTDTALSESNGKAQLVEAFKYPEETAIANALFLIDWGAIRYFEGGHVGWSYTPLPAHLESLVGKRSEILDFNDVKYTERPVTLNYWEFKDEITSPILAGTNASTLGIFASDGGYETVVRAIAERDNINSQRLIPLRLGRAVDAYNLSELKVFDALYLYDWDFKKDSRFYKLLTDYVKSGKKVFIETGVEVKASEGEIPDFFPVKAVVRKGQGMTWDFKNPEGILGNDVNFSDFSPPIFDDTEWKTSSADVSDLRAGARVILTNHGRVVMAQQQLGSGEVIWSGLNFAYHLSRDHNSNEAKFFINILSSLVDISKKSAPESKAKFINGNSRSIEVSGARGILFKEQAYPGWSVRLVESESGKKGKLSIFKAGPAEPGYIYVPIKPEKSTVSLSYGGSFENKVLMMISFIATMVILDEVALRGLILGRARRFVFKRLSLFVGKWWQREDE